VPRDEGLRRAVVRTPWAPVSVVVDPDAVVVASWFGEPRPGDTGHVDLGSSQSVSHIRGVTEALEAWVDGDLDALLRPAVRQPGGPFQQDAWNAMRKVHGGSVVSYTELAAMAGRPRAVRAAGTACATNSVAPFVPCHRIVRTDRGLGGYGFGLDLKAALLAHEGVVPTTGRYTPTGS
jgi:methylated-DNA-[protein]-cysteine S-methyltransferase